RPGRDGRGRDRFIPAWAG
ncbi:hypothetical protein, partial [Rhodobacter capsulatus]